MTDGEIGLYAWSLVDLLRDCKDDRERYRVIEHTLQAVRESSYSDGVGDERRRRLRKSIDNVPYTDTIKKTIPGVRS